MMTEQDKKILQDWQRFQQQLPPSLDEMRLGYARWSETHNYNFPTIGAYESNVELRKDLRSDIAVPAGKGPFPIIAYAHGGGWIMGSASTHRKLAMQLAQLGYLVFNLDYRLAPEHPFPAGLDDCIFASHWIHENAPKWGGDPTRMVMAGDSAGANLAAATLIAVNGENRETRFKAGVLIYGLFDVAATIERSRATEAVAKAYLADSYPVAISDVRVSPIQGVSTNKLPPCLLIVGDADDLMPESQSMASALKAAGIEHKIRVFEAMPHAFMQMGELSACHAGLEEIKTFLGRKL